jgi:hypothetical protein
MIRTFTVSVDVTKELPAHYLEDKLAQALYWSEGIGTPTVTECRITREPTSRRTTT